MYPKLMLLSLNCINYAIHANYTVFITLIMLNYDARALFIAVSIMLQEYSLHPIYHMLSQGITLGYIHLLSMNASIILKDNAVC
jgi:hypothetical protein